jgi:Domain of unknown function (DUF4861)
MKKVAAIILCLGSICSAEDKWFTLKDFGPVTQRLAITVENPADVPNEAALVDIKLEQLHGLLPDAAEGQIAVIDPKGKEAPREVANLNFVPFQVSAGELIFDLPLAAHEKKLLYLYTAPQRLNMPGFPAKTGYDTRKAYRSFENEFVAFRIETGPGANTTGMAIDCWGKTKRGIGLRNVEAYQGENYHKPNYWGMDILGVGHSPGIGGLFLVSGDQMAQPSYVTEFVDPVFTGPIETRLRVTGPVTLNGKTYHLTRILNLVANDRTIHDTVTITGDDLEHVQLGLGIRNFPNETWTEDPKAGYAMVAGDANQPGYKSVAISTTFSPTEFDRVIPLPDQKNGGHVYVFNPTEHTKDGMMFGEHRLTMIWDRDGQINNAGDLHKALVRWAAERDQPIGVTWSEKAEAAPQE